MMKNAIVFFAALVLTFSLQSNATAGPGDYSLRFKGGPSFKLREFGNQVKVGGEFDYDFGYSMGFNLMAAFGISDDFRFQLIPAFRYDYAYVGPASFYGVFGVGFASFDKQSALDMRFGTGLVLPLGDQFEFNTDVNMYVAPVGLPRTVVSLDWMIGFGLRFH
jgi:hypothetical protein